jgi:periplasmic protein TonB
MRTSGRTVLVTVSLGLHVVVGFAFFVSSVWDIEKLEAGNRPFDLAVAPQPEPEGGSPEGSPAPEFKPKKKHEEQPKKVVEETVQPEQKKPEQAQTAATAFSSANASATGTGTGSGTGSGSGNGFGSGSGSGSGSGDGTGSGSGSGDDDDPCKQTRTLAPTVFRGLRVGGDTQIHPPDVTKTEILRSGKTQVIASFRVCIGTDGAVRSSQMMKSSGFQSYDDVLKAGLKTWKYKPYMIEECGALPRPVPVCGMVTFIYGLH